MYMKPVRFHIGLVWAVIAAQVVAASLGPGGLLLCREADGTSHLEWPGEHCCAPGGENSSAPDAEHVELCSGCVDEPLGQSPALATRTPGGDNGNRLSPPAIVAIAAGGLDIAMEASRRSAAPPGSTGPPRPALRALRTTVLVL